MKVSVVEEDQRKFTETEVRGLEEGKRKEITELQQ